MMFFQLMLLAGYGYAHLLTQLVRPSRQFWIHGIVALLGLACLPIAIGSFWVPPVDHSPILWLIGLLAAALGMPFFVLAASAPLLQSWFSRSGHRLSSDPYFLYAASNLGSLLALCAFPALLEPSFTLGQQSRGWAVLYGLLLVLLAGCAWLARAPAAPPAGDRPTLPIGAEIGWRDRLIWIALAAVPSSLMLGVTSYISTDLASAPLLWVLPLGLYLLSFIVAFGRRSSIGLAWALKGQAVGLVAVTTLVLLALIFTRGGSIQLVVVVHLLTFFLTSLVCHVELANRRPGATAITQFYFCMSLGGAIGGVFNALLAPLLFSSTYEYYLGLAAAAALRMVIGHRLERLSIGDVLYPALLAAILAGAVWFLDLHPVQAGLALRVALLFACILPLYGFHERAPRFALGLAALLGSAVFLDGSIDILEQDRGFFGVNRVKRIDGGEQLALFHGTTLHGREFTAPALWREPLGYYGRTGPAGQLLTARQDTRRVALIGLGTGALTCYRQPGQHWRLFEIDPEVAAIARDTRYFHFLSECAGDARIILGDGRLSLASEPDGSEDVIIIDAFSSDSIPLHLLTEEAFRLYLRKLRPGGTVLLHISNLHLALSPIVATLAASLGATAKHQLYTPTAADRDAGADGSEWVALATEPEALAFLDARWDLLVPAQGNRPWTDDFSNIVSALRW